MKRHIRHTQPQALSPPVTATNYTKFFSRFIRDVQKEWGKISWTKKEEWQVYAKIILSSLFLGAVFLYIIDLFLTSLMQWIYVIIGGIFL